MKKEVKSSKKKEIIANFRELIASSHINFLFGAGVNGGAFPQLKNFIKTMKVMNSFCAEDLSFEEKLNNLPESERKIAVDKFCEEFNQFKDTLDYGNNSIINLSFLFKNLFLALEKTENRDRAMKKVNIFTLNYDDIVENVLNDLGYFNNVATVDNLKTMPLFDTVPYNLEYKKDMISFAIAKIHGSIKRNKINPNQIIYPGNKKYESSMAPDFFEVIFKMKSELMKMNSLLFIIGYSGADEHINKIILDAIEVGLTVIWFKYDNANDKIPQSLVDRVITIDQRSVSVDTTLICADMISEVIENGNR